MEPRLAEGQRGQQLCKSQGALPGASGMPLAAPSRARSGRQSRPHPCRACPSSIPPQAGTSHNLGDNFARAFGTRYLDEAGQLQVGQAAAGGGRAWGR